MIEAEYYDNYEKKLQQELVELCISDGAMDGQLLISDDIEEKWAQFAPDYMADSVSQINTFPAAAIAWAGYVGMAVAKWWDEEWGKYCGESYSMLYGSEGFDDMDEHIMNDILCLDADEILKTENIMRSCAHLAINKIRNEQVEAQSSKAFYVFARTVRVLFRVGASLELKRLGYKYERVLMDDLPSDKGIYS